MDGQMFFKTLLQKKNAPIQFTGQDETISFPVKGSDVTIIGSSGDHQVGSSKLHMKNIVNYAWEHKYYPGQVVCHHMGGEYIAYSIITAGKNVGSVRVVNRKTSERILIKGMQGAVVDVSFAHVLDDVVIGCVDELGNLFVYRVTENSAGLIQERMLEVLRDKSTKEEHRLIWCPYLNTLEEGEEEDTSCAYLLLLTHGECVEIWDLNTVIDEHGTGPLRPEDVTDGLLKLTDEGIITDAAFSPDGTALVTTSSHGQVKFFQVYMKGEETPRCLRQWSPHQGKPVSSLIFLDDYSQYNANSSIWKYAVTGCEYNTELKIWSCKTWSCLQTIKMQSRDGEDTALRLKITSDSASKYLILSDIDRNLVYVLTLKISEVEDAEAASVISVTELQTPSPFLSMSCVFAGLRQVSMDEDGMTVEDDSNQTTSNCTDSKQKTVIKLCIVQPKSLQECSLIFDDAAEAILPVEIASQPTYPPIPTMTDGQPAYPPIPAMTDGQPAYPPIPALTDGQPTYPPIPALTDSQSTFPAPPVMPAVNGISEFTITSIDTSGIIRSSSPKFEKPNISSDDLAEAASKITLLSPAKLKPLVPNHPGPDAADTEADEEGDEISEAETFEIQLGPDDEADDGDIEDEEGESDSSVPKLELVPGSVEKDLSGNSSPSREVATILSSDERKYEESPNDSIVRDTQSPVTGAFKLESKILNTSTTKFPTPPSVNLNTSLGGSVNLNTSLGGATSARGSIPLDYNTELSATLTNNSQTSNQSLMNMIYDLQKEVAALRKDLHSQQKLSSSLKENIETTVSSSMASSFNKMEQKLLMDEKALMQHMTTSVSTKCDQVLTMELKRNVVDIVNKALDPLKSRIEAQISNKMNNSEQVIRDSVYKVVNSQGFQDSLTRSVSQSLQPIITESYRNILQVSVPGIEKSLQHTLNNLNQCFLAGTKEYEAVLRSRLEMSEKAQKDELVPVLKEMKRSIAILTSNQNNLVKQMGEMNDRLENKLTSGLTDIVRREVRSGLQNSPHLSSPVNNHSDARDIIQRLLNIGNLDEAFQKALVANDLSLVVYTCEKVDMAVIFNDSPCPLSQSVLLSLIQQLSQQLQDKTEMKINFLEEALCRLDFKDPITRTHVSGVVKNIQSSVHTFIQANPNTKFSRRLRTLLMAINGVLAEANARK